MLLNPNDVHIWSANLTITDEEAVEKSAILSSDERARANRFHFPIHKKRFIAARYALRNILAHYLNIAPAEIVFGYNEHHKPHLHVPSAISLNFNLSHSHDIALYAFRLKDALGIDIEKCEPRVNLGLVNRYFSIDENEHFNRLVEEEKIPAFYRLWTKKEAFIKAVGKGLAIPLASFSVSLEAKAEKIWFENKIWYLSSLTEYPNYFAAIASDQVYQLNFFTFS